MTYNTFERDTIIENLMSIKNIEFLESKKELLNEVLYFDQLYGNADKILQIINNLCEITEIIFDDKK